MCSGIGVTMVLATTVFSCCRRGWKVGLQVVSVPAMVFLVWYAAIGHQGTTADTLTMSLVLHIPIYVWTGVTSALTQISGIPNSGPALLVVLLVGLFAYATRERAWHLAVAGVAGVCGLYLFSALTRLRLGIDQATVSRYVYVAGALLMPLVAWSLCRLKRSTIASSIAFAIVAILVIVNGVNLIDQFTASRLQTLGDLPQRIPAAEQIVNSGQRVLTQLVDPVYDPNITTVALRRPDVRDAFPSAKPGPQALLDASAYIQVGVRTTPYRDVPAAQEISLVGVTGPTPGPHECSTDSVTDPHPFLTAALPKGGGMISVTGQASQLTTQLFTDGLVSPGVVWTVVPGQKFFVASVVSNSTLRVELPSSGTVTVCVG
jgi:hypothetical protein